MTNLSVVETWITKTARPPCAIILGSPAETARLAAVLPIPDITCFQLDLHQADRLRDELSRWGVTGQVVTSPDLWDLPADFQTVFYPAPAGGERELKIDVIEQAFHILRPHGTFVVLSPYEKEQFFPAALKKVFGRVHVPQSSQVQILWCKREKDRPRRRHEMTFRVRDDDGTSLRFLSRPGVFSYGRFDHGARALIETMSISPGDRILDLGCGCGTNGIIAGRRAGPEGFVCFLDSNVRATALAEINARDNGLERFQTVSSSKVDSLPAENFDVILANPPYYAQSSIAQLFIERSKPLLRPCGRFYLVTKQPRQVEPIIIETFGEFELAARRGYTVLCAQA